jgi:hypothetical protein
MRVVAPVLLLGLVFAGCLGTDMDSEGGLWLRDLAECGYWFDEWTYVPCEDSLLVEATLGSPPEQSVCFFGMGTRDVAGSVMFRMMWDPAGERIGVHFLPHESLGSIGMPFFYMITLRDDSGTYRYGWTFGADAGHVFFDAPLVDPQEFFSKRGSVGFTAHGYQWENASAPLDEGVLQVIVEEKNERLFAALVVDDDDQRYYLP